MPWVVCRICSKEFYVRPNHLERGWGKYCSKACQNQGQHTGEVLRCVGCQKEVYRTPKQIRHSKSGNVFCSKSCQTKWRNGFFSEESHPNWINGIHAYRKILLRTGREQVCTGCGKNDTRVLVVHHLDHNRERNDSENLVWLCMNCHYLVHHDQEFEIQLNKQVLKR